MTVVADVTPSGVPDARSAVDSGTGGSIRVRYAHAELDHYLVRIAPPAPPELRVSVQFGQEEGGVWAHIDEFDVSAEGEHFGEAFRNVVSAAKEWLSYVREEAPDLAPELAKQERYVPLLDAPVFSWFKSFRFVE